MGYRHQFISDTLVPDKHNLPNWFIRKYEEIINFDMEYWASFTEYKRYGHGICNLHEDIQKVLNERDLDRPVRLVYFADESSYENPDICHVLIDKHQILEKKWDKIINNFDKEMRALFENKSFVGFLKCLPLDRMLEENNKFFAETMVFDVMCEAYKTYEGNILRIITGSGSFEVNLGKYGL